LEEVGLAAFKLVQLGSRRLLVIDVLPDGWQFLGQAPPAHVGRGDVLHRHIAGWLCMLGIKRGYRAQTEWQIPGNGHAVDAAWIREKHVIAFEVVCECKSNLGAHLDKCLRPRAVESVTIVTPELSAQMDLQDMLAQDPAAKPLVACVNWMSAESMPEDLWPRKQL
jgi:hypothetical protein